MPHYDRYAAVPGEQPTERLPVLDTLQLSDHVLADALLTPRDLIRWCTSVFEKGQQGKPLYYGHGTSCAWDEAVALVMGALHLPHDAASDVLDARLLCAERDYIIRLARLRVETRKPLPYLLGEAWFAGMRFNVDERVLIPRSPIAELIEDGFSNWFPERDPERVLDMCTGSGCIGIATALALPTSHIVLADISDDALEVARINRDRYDLRQRVAVVKSDLFSELKGQRFNLIISNPPYVDDADLSVMPVEYYYEPSMALRSGHDGLALTRRLLAEARQYLTDDGILIVEVGNSERHLQEDFSELPFIWIEFERGGHGVFALQARDLELLSR